MYLCTLPILAALANVREVELAGINYTGLFFLAVTIVGGTIVAMELALSRERGSPFPLRRWMPWFLWALASLLWCEHITADRIEFAMQMVTPAIAAMAGAMFIRSADDSARLFRSFRVAIVLSLIFVAFERLGGLAAFGVRSNYRPLGLFLALLACVALADLRRAPRSALVWWALCLLVAAATESRMATLIILVLPALHPEFSMRRTRIALVAVILLLAIILFHTGPVQRQLFVDGHGTLLDLLRLNVQTTGRLDAWPLIYEEAMNHPLIGAGAGASGEFVPTVWTLMESPHNEYLRVFFDFGAVGLFLVLAAIVIQMRALRTMARSGSDAGRRFASAAFLGFVMLLLMSFTDNPLGSTLWVTLPLFAMTGAAHGRAVESASTDKPTEASR